MKQLYDAVNLERLIIWVGKSGANPEPGLTDLSLRRFATQVERKSGSQRNHSQFIQQGPFVV